MPPADLLSGIRAVASGDAVVAPSVTRRLLDTVMPHLPTAGGEPPPPHPELQRLTTREHEILIQVAAGLSNAEIAEHLVLSDATVKTHVGRVLNKLGLRDRVQAVVYAYETGLVQGEIRAVLKRLREEDHLAVGACGGDCGDRGGCGLADRIAGDN